MSLELLDAISCALLAAGASSRGAVLGARFSGAAALGLACGLSGPLSRELLLVGAEGARCVLGAFPACAFAGSLGGLCAVFLARSYSWRIFFWLDNAGIGLATCLGACVAMPQIGAVGALVLGMVAGLLPGLLRDVALGDTAMLVEQDWYASAAALGAILTLALSALPLFGIFPARIREWSIFSGFFLVLVLRWWKMSPKNMGH